MLAWPAIGGEMTVDGVGSRFPIVEAFGRRPEFFVFNRFIRPRLFSDAMGRAWLRRSTPNHPSPGGS